MRAIEFYSKVKDNLIFIPEEIEKISNQVAHVIVLIEEQSSSKKNRLKKLFKKLSENDIFPGINNPVEWQKQLRNEWK